MPAVVVLGARNLGGAILEHFLTQGWQGAAIARSADTLAAVEAAGGIALQGDAAAPAELEALLARAREDLGGLDLIVNAVSAARPPRSGSFGGGRIADASLEEFRGWGVAVAEQAFTFLSVGARALAAGGGGTLVQVTGGSARRAMPGRGLWSAGAQATRALVQAAAQELRGEGIHVALLVVDATIESPKTASSTGDQPRDALADMGEIARAVRYLAEQTPRGLSHELTLTPAGDRWTP